MDGFALLIAVVTFVMALVALNKISKLESRIATLKHDLAKLLEQAMQPPQAEPAVQRTVVAVDDRGVPIYEDATPEEFAPAPVVTAGNWQTSEPAAQEQPVETLAPPETEAPAATPAPAKPAVRKPDMEQALASRWFVWIGGVAIAIGGLLFVKYAYDNGLISPTLQIVLGLLAGVVLVGAGELVRRKTMTAAEGQVSYVPAALSASGLAILFASIYAAYALYQLVEPTVAFAGLAAVGLGALGLSRWQGPFIAALGLVGSYVTPALIPSEHPAAWSFYPYLLVILAASMFTLRGKSWWWLGYAAIAGAFGWSVLWILGPYQPADIWPVGLFAHLVGLVSLFAIRGPNVLRDDSGRLMSPGSLSQPLVIGLVGLAAETVLLILLVAQAQHSGTALMLLAAAMLLLLALAWVKQGLSVVAPVAGLVMLTTLASWNEAAFHAMTLDESGIWTWSNAIGPQTESYLRWMLGCAAVFTIAGIAGVLLRPAPRSWGALGGAAAFLFIWGAWARTDFLLSDLTWALLAAAAALVLLIGTAAANPKAQDPDVNLGAGLLSAGAAALSVLALDRLLDGVWLTIALSALALAFAALTLVLKPRLLGPITGALATLTTVRLFVSRELWLDDRTLPLGQHWMLYGYGVPIILFYAASRLLAKTGHQRSSVALEGISLGLALSLVSLEIRVLISGNVIYEHPQFLEMAAHILTWSGAAYGLMHRQRLYSSFISLWGSRLLLAASAVSVVLFSLFSLNPVVTGEPVPGNTLFNALLLAYLVPVPLIGLIALRLDTIGWGKLKPAAGVLALVLTFVYLTMETKLVFQGRLMLPQSLSVAESYAYSAVWLGFALALFVAGIRLGKQYVRMAGLAVMALVVLKVFALDMSSLEGLYRIASFIGLGLCLVGIGWLYQRFVHRPAV